MLKKKSGSTVVIWVVNFFGFWIEWVVNFFVWVRLEEMKIAMNMKKD